MKRNAERRGNRTHGTSAISEAVGTSIWCSYISVTVLHNQGRKRFGGCDFFFFWNLKGQKAAWECEGKSSLIPICSKKKKIKKENTSAATWIWKPYLEVHSPETNPLDHNTHLRFLSCTLLECAATEIWTPTLWFTVQRLTCIHCTASPLRFESCTLFESTCVPLMIMVTKIHIIRTPICTLWFSVKRLIHWTTTPLYGYKLYLSWKCL